MQAVDETHARDGPPESTRADEADLSSSSAPPAGIGAKSASDFAHLADTSTAAPSVTVVLDVAEPALQTSLPSTDEGVSRENTSEDTRASVDGLGSDSVEPPTHVTNTTDPAQHAIAMSTAAQPTHAATPTVNKKGAPEDELSGVADGPERSTTSLVEPSLVCMTRRETSRLKRKRKIPPTGDAADVDVSENEAMQPRKSTGDAEPHDRSATLWGGEEVVVRYRKPPRCPKGSLSLGGARAVTKASDFPVSVDEGRPVKQIVTAQAAVRGPPTKPR